MRKKRTSTKILDPAKDMWINPRSNIRGPEEDRAWDNRGNLTSSGGARFLELADIALGLKKPTLKKKKAGASIHPLPEKTEPYSN